jgi:hypothetical protein
MSEPWGVWLWDAEPHDAESSPESADKSAKILPKGRPGRIGRGATTICEEYR